MKEFRFTITDKMGIHARPAGLLVTEVKKYPCKITIEKNGKEVDAKSIFGIMGLGAKYGQEIILRAEGEQEEEAIASLSRFLEDNM